jgi:hypothetical protein
MEVKRLNVDQFALKIQLSLCVFTTHVFQNAVQREQISGSPDSDYILGMRESAIL